MASQIGRSVCALPRVARAERAVHRSFAVLAHSWGGTPVAASEPGQKQRIALLMHGILGSRTNWGAASRRLSQRVGGAEGGDWKVLRLDHRGHGTSPIGQPPHTIDACAEDVLDTLRSVGIDVQRPEVELVVCGHSFGGKVALALRRALLAVGAAPPRMTWVFDSNPGASIERGAEHQRSADSVGVVLEAIEQASRWVYANRAILVDSLVYDRGLDRATANWVAMSARKTQGGVELAYNVEVIRALYSSFSTSDMWEVLEGSRSDIGVVVAGRDRDTYWGSQSLERLERCGDRVKVVNLDNSGHNVHMDDLSGLLAALADYWPGSWPQEEHSLSHMAPSFA